MQRNEKGQFVFTTGGGKYLRKLKNGKNCQLHRLIWETYKGKIPEGYVIHHINGNKYDNRIENLSCVTQKEHNLIHAKDRKIWNKGLTAKTNIKWKRTLDKALNTRNKNYFEKCKLAFVLRQKMSAKEVGDKLGLCTRQVFTILKRYKELERKFSCSCHN